MTTFVDISADNRILVASSGHNAYIYLQSKKTFSLHQTIALTSSVMVSDITSDGQRLLLVEVNNRIRIYENINDTFSLFQALTANHGTTTTYAGAITDDY